MPKKIYICRMNKSVLEIGKQLFIIALCFTAMVKVSANVSKNNCIDVSFQYEKGSALRDTIKDSKEKNKHKFSFKSNKVTFETFNDNYNKAVEYYNKSSYLSAAQLFEKLYPLSIGTPYGDTILFLFAECYFKNKDYQLAAYHFKDYVRRYPGTERTELAALNCVKACYYVSPSYEVDQSDTKYAIEEINDYISRYPHSKYIEECNTMLDELRTKLAQKDFEVIKLYYNTENYKAAQIMVRNFMKEFSYTKYAPEALYLLVKNNFDYASKSVNTKKKERYIACTDAYDALRIQFPNSEFVPLAKVFYDEALKQINILNTKNL
jgi:outer membrane protein assembly factor BamD